MVSRYYICDSCDYSFVIQQQMHEPLKKKCPQCGKMKLYQDLTGQHVHVIGEPTTVGQLAERNSRKMGKEKMEEHAMQQKNEHKANKEKFLKRMGVTAPEHKPTWYNPKGEDLTKKISKLDTPEKQHKYIMEGE